MQPGGIHKPVVLILISPVYMKHSNIATCKQAFSKDKFLLKELVKLFLYYNKINMFKRNFYIIHFILVLTPTVTHFTEYIVSNINNDDIGVQRYKTSKSLK